MADFEKCEFVIFVSILSLILSACALKGDLLQEKYPYARLTPDYGILDENDLRISQRIAEPVPLSEDSISYPYWQCFPTTKIIFSCQNLGTDDSGAQMAYPTIYVDLDAGYEEYGTRRGTTVGTCQEMLADFKDLVRGEQHTCIAGMYVGLEFNNVSNKSSIQGRGWIFDRLKTKKGCKSYFENGCMKRKPK